MKITNNSGQAFELIAKGEGKDGVPPTLHLAPGETIDTEEVDTDHYGFHLYQDLELIAVAWTPLKPPKSRA